MMSRKELEGILGYKLTEDQWKENRKILAKIEEDEWEKDHPMDE